MVLAVRSSHQLHPLAILTGQLIFPTVGISQSDWLSHHSVDYTKQVALYISLTLRNCVTVTLFSYSL